MVFGEVIITFGILAVLFGIYQLWWTNVTSAAETSAAQRQAEAFFASDQSGTNPAIGTPFALMYIPRLRDHVWATPVIQGVSKAELARGVGHYPASAMPGQVGNFAVAGHRATHGEPFAYFDQLRSGDRVFVRTRDAWFTYELLRDRIVDPSEVWTIGPRPLGPNAFPSDKLITLTTCNPRWASTQRWIFWGVQRDEQPASSVPPEVS